KRQREIHEGLISKGLGIISDSYLDRFEKRCRDAGVEFRRKNREGKNFVEILKETEEGGYDLLVMGGLGMGVVENSLIGGVCERVTRKTRKDILVVKSQISNLKSQISNIMVGIDGSPYSYAALMSAISLRKVFGGEVEAVAVFDPYFHQVAFRNIADALTEEASKVFRFKEQEKLHDEIIDKGLARLYQSYLDTAYKVARARGVEIRTTLLAGKAFNEILKHIQIIKPSLLVVGRFGIHQIPESVMGNTAENLLRMTPTNIFISSGELKVVGTDLKSVPSLRGFRWTEEALKRMNNVPDFVRGMAKKAIEDYASERSVDVITSEVVDEAKKRFGM
ncbi:MAG: universal stress protein, partial [Deltaproteobacteria bacterium]|nr:universal stress protein [Deltaproteobacteria bacterium]